MSALARPDLTETAWRLLQRHASSFALRSALHGPRHWQQVVKAGEYLLAHSDTTVVRDTVMLFAVIHDSQRLTDGNDPEHGIRAAQSLYLYRELIPAGAYEALEYAIANHANGEVSSNSTVGICWDADRLTLGRLGRVPCKDALSTECGRSAETLQWAQRAFRPWR